MMKRLIILCLFGALSSFSLNLMADQADTTDTKSAAASSAAKETDNTMDFFVALSGCVPGDYKEKNIMAEQFGPVWLKHTINGPNKDLCNVTLATPDGRQLDCNFEQDDLKAVVDQHFIIGILSNDDRNPSEESIRADKIWTDLKSNACGL